MNYVSGARRSVLAHFYIRVACATITFVFLAASLAAAQIPQSPPLPAQVEYELSSRLTKTGDHIPSAPTSPVTSLHRAESVAVGELDPTFTPVFDSKPGFAYTVATQSDGKFLVGGGFKSFNGFATSGIVRLNADRSVDTSFSADISGTVFSIAIQPDGKIVIGGTFVSVDNVPRYSVARLNADGSLDATLNTSQPTEDIVRDILLQPDGKIVAVGNFDYINGMVSPRIARLNPDGTLDAGFQSPMGFGTPGSPDTFISSVALQSDGRLVIVGSFLVQGAPDRKFIYRLNASGTPDGTFTPPAMSSNPWSVALQADGKIVIGGFFTTISSVSRPRLARLNSNGSLDMSFNPGTGANSSVLSVSVLPNGQIMATGNFSSVNGTPRGGVALLNPEGALDTTFAPAAPTTGAVYGATPSGSGYLINGTFINLSGADRPTVGAMNGDGGVDLSFSADTRLHTPVRAILVLPDGKMIVGGLFNHLNGIPCAGITRLNANGTRDMSFDGAAVNALNVGRLVRQADGKILVIGAGIRINNGPTKLIVRLNADGTPDASFDHPTIPQSTQGNTAAVQQDGKIVFSFHTTTDTVPPGGLIRLNSDGSIDEAFGTSNRQVDAIQILPDGKILIGGPFSLTYVGPGGSEAHSAVMRLNSDGSHDRAFRSGLLPDHPTFSEVHAMHVQGDGKILVGGKLYVGDGSTAFGVLRLNETGTIDGSFQGQAIAGPFYFTNVNALHVTTSGKILAAGVFNSFGGAVRNNIVRLLPNGLVDNTFTTGTDKGISTVTTQANGSILIGGTFGTVNGTARPVIARLLAEPAQNKAPFDFDGDGKTDLGIFRPSAAEWWINRSSDGNVLATQFGATSDRIVPADYTGDGKSDIGVWRPTSGEWLVLRSDDFTYYAFPFGANGDVPATADYDADGKADATVFRPSTATWFVFRSTGGTTIETFGANGDIPVPADYDGDGKADIAIFRPSNGQWWINRSTAGLIATTFGDADVKPVQGDYTGDGKSDVAFFRPSTNDWFVLRSEDFSFYAFPFGALGDTPAPGDYDGDGKFDATVFRSSNATWYSNRSSGSTLIQQFGATGDRPIPNAFVP